MHGHVVSISGPALRRSRNVVTPPPSSLTYDEPEACAGGSGEGDHVLAEKEIRLCVKTNSCSSWSEKIIEDHQSSARIQCDQSVSNVNYVYVGGGSSSVKMFSCATSE